MVTADPLMRIRRLIAAALVSTLTACDSPPEPTQPSSVEAPAPSAYPLPTDSRRIALFGDLHVHTSWSFDAYSLGVQTTPEHAYAYAMGKPIPHVSGSTIQAQRPLDFMALTEHSEYMGVSVLAREPDHPVRRSELITGLESEDPAIRTRALGRFAAILSGSEPVPELLTDEIVRPVWRRIAEFAERYNAPGRFTAFVGYEWTSMPEGQNLHRNVVFADGNVPKRPFSSIDSRNAEDLWRWMDTQRAAGLSDVIAIPHNGNTSNGLMYAATDWSGDPIDAAYADLRGRNEPISEIFQIKGQSEAHPALSPDDAFAGFEQFDRILGRMTESSRPAGSFAREALKDGLTMSTRGFNPYDFGVIGSSDGHNASSPVEEDNYTGKIGNADGTARQRLLDELSASLPLDAVSRWGAAGLAGVWAGNNSRAEIFAALRRKETFATSGPRIQARFFGGCESLQSTGDATDLVTIGYARGVPMGGRLAACAEQPPNFAFWVIRDPNEAGLERVQIVKLWSDGARAFERIIDLACASGAPDAHGRCAIPVPEPDATCSIDANAGVSEFRGYWHDADYTPGTPTAYYLRALQVPTCRWSTYDAKRLGIDVPAHLPRTLQERAVTSAIWISGA